MLAQHCHLLVGTSTAAQVLGRMLWDSSPLPTPFMANKGSQGKFVVPARLGRVPWERRSPPHAPVYTLGRWGAGLTTGLKVGLGMAISPSSGPGSLLLCPRP